MIYQVSYVLHVKMQMVRVSHQLIKKINQMKTLKYDIINYSNRWGVVAKNK